MHQGKFVSYEYDGDGNRISKIARVKQPLMKETPNQGKVNKQQADLIYNAAKTAMEMTETTVMPVETEMVMATTETTAMPEETVTVMVMTEITAMPVAMETEKEMTRTTLTGISPEMEMVKEKER